MEWCRPQIKNSCPWRWFELNSTRLWFVIRHLLTGCQQLNLIAPEVACQTGRVVAAGAVAVVVVVFGCNSWSGCSRSHRHALPLSRRHCSILEVICMNWGKPVMFYCCHSSTLNTELDKLRLNFCSWLSSRRGRSLSRYVHKCVIYILIRWVILIM